MKYYVLAFAASVALAQSSTTTYTTNINGGTVATPGAVSTDHQQTQITQSLNGRTIPLEQSEERVLSETPQGKVTEKITRRYDRNGQLVSTERLVTDEQRRPSGSTVNSTMFQSDINGNMSETEHKTVESDTHGAVTDTQTVIARPTLDGSLATVEKRSQVSETSDHSTHSDETVFRQSGSGDFYPAVRNVTDTTKSGNQTVEKSAQYEPIANVSGLQLTRQTVATTTQDPNGSEQKEVSYYGPSVPGNVRDPNAPLRLYEQDITQRSKQAGGGVVETLSARRPTMSNPNQLGPATRISETVCTGKCDAK